MPAVAVRVGRATDEKLAVTFLFAFIVSEQAPVPEQSPDQPENV